MREILVNGETLNACERYMLIDLLKEEIKRLGKDIEIARKYNLKYRAFETRIKQYKLLIEKLEF